MKVIPETCVHKLDLYVFITIKQSYFLLEVNSIKQKFDD